LFTQLLPFSEEIWAGAGCAVVVVSAAGVLVGSAVGGGLVGVSDVAPGCTGAVSVGEGDSSAVGTAVAVCWNGEGCVSVGCAGFVSLGTSVGVLVCVAVAEGEGEIFSTVVAVACFFSGEAVGVAFLLNEHPLVMMNISKTGKKNLCGLIGIPFTCSS